MPEAESILVLGQFRSEEKAAISAAASQAGFDPVFATTSRGAIELLDTTETAVVLVETTCIDADKLCYHVRREQRLLTKPLLGLARELSDRTYAKGFSWGVDDLVRMRDLGPLARRLQAIALTPKAAPRTGAKLRTAVVADLDAERCTIMGCVLGEAGFEVRYAGDERSLEYYAKQPSTNLIVAHAELGPLKSVIRRCKEDNASAAWVILAPPSEVEAWAEGIAGLGRVGVTNVLGPPQNVAFFANELLNGKDAEQRAGARSLYGTTVAFRPAGKDTDDHGFTYNVSANGMYVRSLLALGETELWLEVRPPRSERLVRLFGKVTWKRTFASGVRDGTPPGFAVKVLDGLATDLAIWTESCERLSSQPTQRSDGSEPAGRQPKRTISSARLVGLGPLESPKDRQGSWTDVRQLLEESLTVIQTPARGESPVTMDLHAEDSLVTEVLGDVGDRQTLSKPRSQQVSQGPDFKTLSDEEISSLLPAERNSARAADTTGANRPVVVAAEAPPPSPLREPLREPLAAAAREKPRPALGGRKSKTGLLAALLCLLLLIAAATFTNFFDDGGTTAIGPLVARGAPATNRPKTPPPSVSAATSAAIPSAAIPSAAATSAAVPSAAGATNAPAAGSETGIGGSSFGLADQKAGTGAGAASAGAGTGAEGGIDLSSLGKDKALLRVRSSKGARVFVHGVDSGETNTVLTTRCGPRFVRLATRDHQFIDAGRMLMLRCQELNELDADLRK